MNSRLYLDFYGIRVSVECADPEIWENIRRDFSYFSAPAQGKTDIQLEVHLATAPYAQVPPIKASLYNPDSISYDHTSTRYVDYHGKALSIYDYKSETGRIYSADKSLLHEICYLLILSRIGERLDKKGIHRIHALGLAVNGKGALCLLPQGAGKTTLALELLKHEEIKLLSDDTVLLKKDGSLLAFPLRIGVAEAVVLDVPDEHIRSFTRRKYGAKLLIDVEHFRNKIAPQAKPAIILVGQRLFTDQAKICNLNKMKALGPLIRDGVIGLGLAQMVEYFLRLNLKDIFAKIVILSSRLLVCFNVLLHSRAYRFHIGRDTQKNAEALLAFLKSCNKR